MTIGSKIGGKMRSPYIVTYDDLITAARVRLEWMLKTYPERVQKGILKEWTATHNICCQKKILALLRRYKKNPQVDLFSAFESMNAKQKQKD